MDTVFDIIYDEATQQRVRDLVEQSHAAACAAERAAFEATHKAKDLRAWADRHRRDAEARGFNFRHLDGFDEIA